MALYEISADGLQEIDVAKFATLGIREREDLQRLLRQGISVVAPGCMVLAEEFEDWDASQRRIDLLLLDEDAHLVVVELKRDERGGHMELQALRYAAMVSPMTFEQAVRAHEKFLAKQGRDENARERILDFLGWESPEDGEFAGDVRIVLAAADFSRELTTSVIWLNARGLDIRCVQLRPLSYGGKVLLDIQQVLPLPEAQDFQVRVQEKERRRRTDHGTLWDPERMLAEIERHHGEQAKEVADDFLRWGAEKFADVSWGQGQTDGLVTFRTTSRGVAYPLFRINTNGNLVLLLDQLHRKSAFQGSRVREVFAAVVAGDETPLVSADQLSYRKRIPLSDLTEAQAREAVRRLIERIAEQIEVITGGG
ncbi:MAG: hypothetical protein KDA44_02095 [Planctomycetales bacterium]|nr:hypothetical protein [Planctomycetales bacterium]